MFPNFTSLAQREQKRQELLEKAQRRVRQANAKREMYQATSWATDVSNSITTIAKKATATTQTDTGVGTDESIPDAVRQTLNDVIEQTIAQSDLKKISVMKTL
jgi:gas vesicle protein